MAADFIFDVVISKDVLLSYVVDVKRMTDADKHQNAEFIAKYMAPNVGAPAAATPARARV